jgi:hypothetical protein
MQPNPGAPRLLSLQVGETSRCWILLANSLDGLEPALHEVESPKGDFALF